MARQTIEHKITEYFQSEPLAAVNVLFGIVKGTMQTRNASAPASEQARRTRSQKRNANARKRNTAPRAVNQNTRRSSGRKQPNEGTYAPTGMPAAAIEEGAAQAAL